MTTTRLRWVVKYTACGPSPTCDERNVESSEEWGVLKTTAIQWTGWREGEHKTLPEHFWGAKSLEVRKGDVIVTKAGPRHRVGVSSYVNETRPQLIVSGKMILLRVDDSAIDPRYLNWYLSTPRPQGYLNACKTGMAEAQMNFANEDLLGMEIQLPPIDEQRRIADFLDAETARIDHLAALQTTARTVVLARIVAYRDLKIDKLAATYGTLPFRRRVWSIEQGSSPQCDNFPAGPEEWGVLKVSAVKNGSFVGEENKQLPAHIEPERRYEIQQGDLLITRANTPRLVGAAAVADSPRRKLILCDKIFRVATTPDLLPEFLVLVSLTTRIRDMCAEASHGTSQSMANLKTEEIKRWPVPAVPVPVQRAAIEELSEARSHAATLTDAVDRQLALLVERRQALITAAVTGAISV
jgi:type I restriction enzyme, S subunit